MKIFILIVTILLGACTSTPTSDVPAENTVSRDIPITKDVYYFQHKILPQWTFTSEGGFYADLLQGELDQLKIAASEVISEDYAKGISSDVLDNGAAVLITFPKPKAMANCYYVLIQTAEAGFKFYTYEKTMNFGEDDPVVGVVGRWSADGNHYNLGPRTYTKASEFVSDILGITSE